MQRWTGTGMPAAAAMPRAGHCDHIPMHTPSVRALPAGERGISGQLESLPSVKAWVLVGAGVGVRSSSKKRSPKAVPLRSGAP